jgi:hypothetical protein
MMPTYQRRSVVRLVLALALMGSLCTVAYVAVLFLRYAALLVPLAEEACVVSFGSTQAWYTVREASDDSRAVCVEARGLAGDVLATCLWQQGNDVLSGGDERERLRKQLKRAEALRGKRRTWQFVRFEDRRVGWHRIAGFVFEATEEAAPREEVWVGEIRQNGAALQIATIRRGH